jgi:hypothetical protein
VLHLAFDEATNNNPFRGHVLTPNTILFTWPAFDYSLELGCADRDEIAASVQQYLADAIDVEHNLLLMSLEKTKIIDHCKQHLLVVFPAFVTLSVGDRSEMRPGAFYLIGEKFSGLFVSICLSTLEKFSAGIGLENIDQWCEFSFDWLLYLCHECFV